MLEYENGHALQINQNIPLGYENNHNIILLNNQLLNITVSILIYY